MLSTMIVKNEVAGPMVSSSWPLSSSAAVSLPGSDRRWARWPFCSFSCIMTALRVWLRTWQFNRASARASSSSERLSGFST